MKTINFTVTEAELAKRARNLKAVEPKTELCAWCGDKFTIKRAWQKFCNDACRTASHSGALERELDLYKRLWSHVPAEIRAEIEGKLVGESEKG